MITEAIMLGHIRGPNPARQLAEKPDVVKKLTIYRDKVRALMTLGLGFEPCHEGDLLGKALEIQDRHSLIAAIALRIEADVLVSADTRFQAIKELRTYAPSDVKLPSIQ